VSVLCSLFGGGFFWLFLWELGVILSFDFVRFMLCGV